MSSGSFKNVIKKNPFEMIYLILMYKKDLALNNRKWFIFYKTKTNQTRPIYIVYQQWN